MFEVYILPKEAENSDSKIFVMSTSDENKALKKTRELEHEGFFSWYCTRH